MRIPWSALVTLVALGAACGGKVSELAQDGGADAGPSSEAGSGADSGPMCDPFVAARACQHAGGDCGSGGSATCPRGYKPSPNNVCTSPCPGGVFVACCIPDFGPHPDAG